LCIIRVGSECYGKHCGYGYGSYNGMLSKIKNKKQKNTHTKRHKPSLERPVRLSIYSGRIERQPTTNTAETKNRHLGPNGPDRLCCCLLIIVAFVKFL
jgi:hypothetical protein